MAPVALPHQAFARARVERVIAVVRVVFAASSLFAVWFDHSGRYLPSTYALHAAYLAYAVLVAGVMWRRDTRGITPLLTHIGDIAIAAVLQVLTLGPASPFFTFFVFALFSAALRWGWRATVQTAAVVLTTYMVIGVWLSQSLGAEFEVDRFIIRTTYLFVVAVVLVYLGQHEAWLRDEIQRLASWPVTPEGDWSRGVPRILEHASGIAGAERAVLVWTIDEEPKTYVSAWPGDASITTYPPDAIEPMVARPLADATFSSEGASGASSSILVNARGSTTPWEGDAVHEALRPYLNGARFTSAPFRAAQVSGRVFFAGLPSARQEVAPLVEVLAREIGASLEILHSQKRSQDLAVVEERIRVARNLHDGVLQALTGIRLELQRMAAQERQAASPLPVGERLLSIERALSLEQRELRSFIEDLKPRTAIGVEAGSVVSRLDELRRRLTLEWRTPITIRVSPEQLTVPAAYDLAVPLMVHEAVVNAIQHGKPTRVAVEVRVISDMLRITVTDDGSGFPFTGRREHAALVAENSGPVSLRERAASLGGRISVESSAAGSRVELAIPLGAVHA